MPKNTIDGLIKKELIDNRKKNVFNQKKQLNSKSLYNRNTKEGFNGFNLFK